MIELCIQGSIKPEPPWIVPLLERKISGKNENSSYTFSAENDLLL